MGGDGLLNITDLPIIYGLVAITISWDILGVFLSHARQLWVRNAACTLSALLAKTHSLSLFEQAAG